MRPHALTRPAAPLRAARRPDRLHRNPHQPDEGHERTRRNRPGQHRFTCAVLEALVQINEPAERERIATKAGIIPDDAGVQPSRSPASASSSAVRSPRARQRSGRSPCRSTPCARWSPA